MKNRLDNFTESGTAHGWENDYIFAKMSASPDQLAIVWNGNIDIVTALPVPGGTSGSYDIDLLRLPSDYNLAATLKRRRENYPDLPKISERTLFLTIVSDYTERTRLLALDGEVLALDDDDLSEWLVGAEKEFYTGTDNHPLFETSLEDTASSIMRLPNGQVTMTEVPRTSIFEIKEQIGNLTADIERNSFDQENSILNLVVETPLRCAARYFLTALAEGENILRSEKSSEVTAFIVIGKSGFSYGLWSSKSGLFNEYAFLAPTEIRHQPPISEIDTNKTDDPKNSFQHENLETYIKNAFDQLFLQLTQDNLDQFQLSNYAQVVWITESDISETVQNIASDYSENTGMDFFKVDVPVDEAVASGLLLGSFNFGDSTVIGAEILPPVNMARDILALADKEEIERRKLEESLLQKRRTRAVFTLLVAPVLVFACLLALVADIARQQVTLGIRELRADNRTIELKPALDRRISYEANLKWYQEFIRQVSAIRRQQPVGIQMLYNLNSSYPFNLDSSFYISELKLLPDGGVEIKGLSRNKEAVTSFLRTLEFTGGTASGSKLFTNLTYEVQEGINQVVTKTDGQTPAVPQVSGSSLGDNSLAPGIIAWNIKGNYFPIAEFIPPDPKKLPPPPNTTPNAAPPANPAPPIAAAQPTP